MGAVRSTHNSAEKAAYTLMCQLCIAHLFRISSEGDSEFLGPNVGRVAQHSTPCVRGMFDSWPELMDIYRHG